MLVVIRASHCCGLPKVIKAASAVATKPSARLGGVLVARGDERWRVLVADGSVNAWQAAAANSKRPAGLRI